MREHITWVLILWSVLIIAVWFEVEQVNNGTHTPPSSGTPSQCPNCGSILIDRHPTRGEYIWYNCRNCRHKWDDEQHNE